MFIQVFRGHVTDPAAAEAAVDRWQAELKPGAQGYLGMTSGVADDATFIAVVRFTSAEAARANGERPEQGAWWAETSRLFDSEPRFYDCPTVDVLLGGRSDDAGFVQLEICTGVTDVDAVRAIDKEFERLAHLRPDLLGGHHRLHHRRAPVRHQLLHLGVRGARGRGPGVAGGGAGAGRARDGADRRGRVHRTAHSLAAIVTPTERFDTVVIGAGQAGLATGHHLARRGVDFVLLDAGDGVGHAWRRR